MLKCHCGNNTAKLQVNTLKKKKSYIANVLVGIQQICTQSSNKYLQIIFAVQI